MQLKQSGWIGNYALGSSYISLPWYLNHSLGSIVLILQNCISFLDSATVVSLVMQESAELET